MSTQDYHHLALPGQPGAPTVFAFHGTGGDEHQFVELVRDVAPGATLIAPRGDVSEHGAVRFFRRTAEGVYDMDDLARATTKMAGFVRRRIGEQRTAPVVGIGYSNGANILASVVFDHPEMFDMAILMHPLIPFAPKIAGSLQGRRILITAGRHDPICPPNLTARLEAHLRQAGADLTLEWHGGGHEIRQSEIDAVRAFLAEAPETSHA